MSGKRDLTSHSRCDTIKSYERRAMGKKREFTKLTATVEPKDIFMVEGYAEAFCEDNFSQAVRHLLRAGAAALARARELAAKQPQEPK